MLLTGPDGARLELRVLGYELPDADPADDEWDANWLVLSRTARTERGEAWSFRSPALTTWELAELASWLRRAADHGVGLASTPQTPAVVPEDEPFWWDRLRESGWLTFVEPNLSAAVAGYQGGRVQVVVGLGAEMLPPPRPEEEHAWGPLPLLVTPAELRDAAASLESDLRTHPVR